jgi:hypothetical protein
MRRAAAARLTYGHEARNQEELHSLIRRLALGLSLATRKVLDLRLLLRRIVKERTRMQCIVVEG